jgi:hypothetical protein
MNSNQLLRLLKEKCFPTLYIYPNRFNPIDAIIEEYDLAVEVKCKNSFYADVYIEEQKYRSLMKHKRCRYINAMKFETGTIVIYSFNLRKLAEPKWEIVMNPDASNELYTGWVPTSMGLLNIQKAQNITKLLIN